MGIKKINIEDFKKEIENTVGSDDHPDLKIAVLQLRLEEAMREIEVYQELLKLRDVL